jgi:hypothetical protein
MIRDVEYHATGQDSHYHEVGTVTVYFSNCRVIEFERIERGHFNAWAATGYAVNQAPYDMMQQNFGMWCRQFEENALQDELEDDEEDFYDDDFEDDDEDESMFSAGQRDELKVR